MKSLQDFLKMNGGYTELSHSEYKMYLKHYYCGQVLASLILKDTESNHSPFRYAKDAFEYADAMVNELLK